MGGGRLRGQFFRGFYFSQPITIDYTRQKISIADKDSRKVTSLVHKIATLIIKANNYINMLLLFYFCILPPPYLAPIKNLKMFFGQPKIVRDIGAKIYVIPSFTNMILEYELHGDYSRYIERIEIRRNHQPRRWRGYRLRRGWRAAFYFKEEPKEGYMLLKYI